MYLIKLSKEAQKNILELDRRYQSAVAKAIDKLASNPKAGKPLKNELKGYWKLRFSRYRIIYQIFKNELIVLVMTVEHRKDVYRP